MLKYLVAREFLDFLSYIKKSRGGGGEFPSLTCTSPKYMSLLVIFPYVRSSFPPSPKPSFF